MKYKFKYWMQNIADLVKLFFAFVGLLFAYIFVFVMFIGMLATPFIAIAFGIYLIGASICLFASFC